MKKPPDAGEPCGGDSRGGPATELSLEQAMDRLEQIAREVEAGTLDLEASLQRYREARELYTLCVARLSEAEREVRVLMADGSLASESSTAPAEGEE